MKIERIIKDCFGDSNFTPEEIREIAKHGNIREKQYLFDKILMNITNLFADLNIFTKDDIEQLLKNFRIPAIRKELAERRKNLVEVYFFDKPLLVEELKWKI